MREYQKELELLREELACRRENSAVLRQLLQQEITCTRTLEQRRIEWDQEHQDVERMERVSLSSVWATLRGTKEEDLRREKAEEQAALLKLQAAQRQLDEVQEEIRQRYARLKETEGCEARYEALLREKEEACRAKDSTLAAKLAELEQRKLELISQRRELQEARDAGAQALGCIRNALDSLDSAAGWSTWDVWGGGLITDMMKYSHMDEAQQRMECAQSALRRYQTELADVAVAASFELQPDGFTRTMDIFFDNIFSDWAVRDHIDQSQSRLTLIEGKVSRMQERLHTELDETSCGLDALEQEWKSLVENA